MKEQLEKRLQELKAEYKSGQAVMSDLETKQANVRDALLRISGAIQVIEEELAKLNNTTNGQLSVTEPKLEVEQIASTSQ